MTNQKATNNPLPVSIAAGTNSKFSHSITVAAPSERVWGIWIDVANWPSWDTPIIRASSDAPLALGVKGSVIPKKGMTSHFKVTAFEVGKRYAFDTALPGATLHIHRFLSAADNSTTFTHEVEFSGPAAWLFARLLGPGFRAILPAVMNNIATQALQIKQG
jgi:uncharacterized membrane protein